MQFCRKKQPARRGAIGTRFVNGIFLSFKKATQVEHGCVVHYYDGQEWVHMFNLGNLAVVDAGGLLTVWRDACIAHGKVVGGARELPEGFRFGPSGGAEAL